MKKKVDRPLILVVNDDGIRSNGIQFLTSVMQLLGNVYTVAPDSNRSAMSHAMTLNNDIYVQPFNNKKQHFICSGTPVDCVKLAINKILPKLPDLCVSGVNHGSNHSINAQYSGTLHSAMEAAIHGVPAISFSHLSYDDATDLSLFTDIILNLCSNILNKGLPDSITLNINIPNMSFKKIKGIKICQQAEGFWKEDFQYIKTEGLKKYYSISGKFHHQSKDVNTDAWALENGFISLVPIGKDLTDYSSIKLLKFLEHDF